MRLLSTLAAALVLSLAGCSYDEFPCDGSFRIDDARIDRDHWDAIGRAMDRWNELAGREHFYLSPSGRCPIIVMSDEDATKGLIAEYRRKDGEAWIWFPQSFLGAPIARFEIIAMHELGHSEGLYHLPGEDHVMSRNPSRLVRDFTAEDVAECRRAGLCP